MKRVLTIEESFIILLQCWSNLITPPLTSLQKFHSMKRVLTIEESFILNKISDDGTNTNIFSPKIPILDLRLTLATLCF